MASRGRQKPGMPGGLRFSKDGTVHVDHRRFRTYVSKGGDAKLVPVDERGKVKRQKRR